MNTEQQIEQVAQALAKYCLDHGYKIVTAESCTGGWVSHAIVSLPGSSAWFEGGFVTYSNEAKEHCLQVPHELIESKGAVSEEVARAMVKGALAATKATHAVAVTGLAGPSGGTSTKPVGLVWFAWGDREGNITSKHFIFEGDRTSIRAQAVVVALREFISIS